jgi:hypothetical protein
MSWILTNSILAVTQDEKTDMMVESITMVVSKSFHHLVLNTSILRPEYRSHVTISCKSMYYGCRHKFKPFLKNMQVYASLITPSNYSQ